MAKSIGSGELFGNASLGPPAPVVHTDPDHRKCAYYEVRIGVESTGFMCEHGHQAFGGGYYSEDFVRGQLFPLIHKAINGRDTAFIGRDDLGFVLARADVQEMLGSLDELRELTK